MDVSVANLGITSSHSVAFVDPEVVVGSQRSSVELSHPSKQAPINRPQGDAGKLQNVWRPYYKPGVLCSRGPARSAAHTPSKPHIPMSKPVGIVSKRGPRCDLSSWFGKTSH